MVLGSCMQVQNIIELWNLTAAPPVDDRVRSCRLSCMHTCTCMRQGNNVFSDCNEKLERPFEAGTMMLTVWSSSRGLDKDESWMTIHGHLVLLFLAPTDWKASTKHRMAKLARARVVVQDGSSKLALRSIFRSSKEWKCLERICAACLAPHSSIASRSPPPPTPTLSRLRSWRRWGKSDGVLSSEGKRG